MTSRIGHRIPAAPLVTVTTGVTLESADEFGPYDVALGGIGFMYANTANDPMIRETAPYEKQRIDQEQSAGENTLTNWWIRSQDSFHGGAGQLNLEPPTQDPNALIRYQLSKNVDPFTPGYLRRLPDTTKVSSELAAQVVSLTLSGADAVAIRTSAGAAKLITGVTGSPTVTPFAGLTTGVLSIATDGARVYAATSTHIYVLDPAAPGAGLTSVVSYTAATHSLVLGWAKSRLMLGYEGGVYEIDVSTTGVALGATQLRFQHPTPGWTWRCFVDTPQTLMAAGDAGQISEIIGFTVAAVSGAPVLQPAGTIGHMPVGERVLSICNPLGSFLGIGTNRGIRIGTFDSFYGRLSYGPLELSPVDPTISANAVFTRDRFLYAANLAYDESGLMAVDLGTQTDQAGRFAWAPNLITPTVNLTDAVTDGTVLPVSNQIVFCIPTGAQAGVYLEGTGPGSGREAWLRTSRIRYDTTEPKLWKFGSVRGDLATGSVSITGSTEAQDAIHLATDGFTTTRPPDYRLPAQAAEWLQLTFLITGASVVIRGYSTKALPGTKKQRQIKLVLSLYDTESSKTGRRVRDHLAARDRMYAIEALDAANDTILLQEFTPFGTFSTLVQVVQVSFSQIGRPTGTSDIGGTAEVIVRTVE